jgi:hypothetical protein
MQPKRIRKPNLRGMKTLVIVILAVTMNSCLSTHGCVGKANHNKKVAHKLHKKRAKQHHRSHVNF